MPEMPKGPAEKIGGIAKDALEAGRKLLKKAEAGGEQLLKKVEQATGIDVAEDGARLLDHVKKTVEIKKPVNGVPREQVKLKEPIKLDDVHVPNRPYPKTPHGDEIRALLEKYAEVRDNRFIEELARFPAKEEIPAYLEILRNEDRSVLKGAAAARLKQLGATEAVPDLIKAIKDAPLTDNDVSFWVADALVTLDKDHASVPTLVDALERSMKLGPAEPGELEPDLVRTDFVKALGAMKDQRAVATLVRLLGQASTDFETSQKYAMEALGKIGGKEALAALKKSLLTAGNAGAAFWIGAMAQRGSEEAAEVLMLAARTGNLEVRVKSVEQLATLAVKQPQGKAARLLRDLSKAADTPAEVKKTISSMLEPWPKMIPAID